MAEKASTAGSSEVAQSESDNAVQSLPSPCTSPEKSPGPTIVWISGDDGHCNAWLCWNEHCLVYRL